MTQKSTSNRGVPDRWTDSLRLVEIWLCLWCTKQGDTGILLVLLHQEMCVCASPSSDKIVLLQVSQVGFMSIEKGPFGVLSHVSYHVSSFLSPYLHDHNVWKPSNAGESTTDCLRVVLLNLTGWWMTTVLSSEMPELWALSSFTIYVAAACQEGFLGNGNSDIRNLDDCFCLVLMWWSKQCCHGGRCQNSMVIYTCSVSNINLHSLWTV